MNSLLLPQNPRSGRAQAGRMSGLSAAHALPGIKTHPQALFWSGTGTHSSERTTSAAGRLPQMGWTPKTPQPRLHLLVVEQDAEIRGACAEIGSRAGLLVVQASDVTTAQAVIRQQQIDLVLMEAKALAGGGNRGSLSLSLLEEIKTLHPETSVIVMTAAGTVQSAVEAMRLGAEDYLTKPFALEELTARLERAARRTQINIESRLLRDRLRTQRGSGPLVGHSPQMEKLFRILSKVANSTHPVLIFGEHGTGKELIARSIHFNGAQAAKGFTAVDCAAIPMNVLETQLFGYVRGADVEGAVAEEESKDGLLVTAAGGTVFLDEVSSLSLDLQAKLVRVLQEKVVQPIGGTHTVPLAARLLASTQTDLNALVEQGRFRRDLYFRLNVVSLRIPPLRSRKEDIPELAQYFLERMQRNGSGVRAISDDALRVLLVYDWPSNVRELEACIERACTMSSGPILNVSDLPSPLLQEAERLAAEALNEGAQELRRRSTDRIQSMAEIERNAILGTIRHLHGDKLRAARLLGIGKTTLYRKLKEYGIQEWDS